MQKSMWPVYPSDKVVLILAKSLRTTALSQVSAREKGQKRKRREKSYLPFYLWPRSAYQGKRPAEHWDLKLK